MYKLYNSASSRRAAPTASTSPRTSPAASGSTGRPSSPSPGSSGTGDNFRYFVILDESSINALLKGPVAAMPAAVRPAVRGQRGVPLQRGRAEGREGPHAGKRRSSRSFRSVTSVGASDLQQLSPFLSSSIFLSTHISSRLRMNCAPPEMYQHLSLLRCTKCRDR